MFARLSITWNGMEIYYYGSKNYTEANLNPDLFAGFLEAMQIYSEMMGSAVKYIQFSNMHFYLHSYGEYSIRYISDIRMDTELLNKILPQVYEIISNYTDGKSKSMVIPESFSKDHLEPLLKPLFTPEGSVDDVQDYVESRVIKLGIAGIGNAGKTTTKRIFFEKLEKDKVENIRPTLGVEMTKEKVDFINQKLMIMDYGGQTSFREQYLTQRDIWKDLTTLIYVIDIQNKDVFEEAKNYLDKVWKHVNEINTISPQLVIFLHKYDPEMRKQLAENVGLCLNIFQDYIEKSIIHVTSIQDDSSNTAVMKTLYFSLPNVILKKLFEENFMNEFYFNFLPQLKEIVTNQKLLGVSGDDFKRVIDQMAVLQGVPLGLSLQKEWLKYLKGEWKPSEQKISLPNVEIKKQQKSHILTVGNFESDLDKDIIIIALNGFLKGISKIFHLSPPTQLEKEGAELGRWELEM